jgi:hypothetical protein
VKEIELTQGFKTTVDDEDYERLNKRKWHLQREKCGLLYAVSSDRVLMHRLILNPPGHFEIDHRDGNGLNNYRSNLRRCTHRQNICNRKVQKHSSLFKGVIWCPRLGKWRAEIRVWGKKIHLGLFTSETEASESYNKAAKSYQGEFARTN